MSKPWKTKEDRAAEMEQISKQLEEGVKQFFTSETYKDYLQTIFYIKIVLTWQSRL